MPQKTETPPKKMFEPGLSSGEVISNRRLMSIFQCACEGGIRYSSKTATLVLVVNDTLNGLPNTWKDGILWFAGRIMKDGETLKGANRRLDTFLHDGGDIFLFEVHQPGKYEYKGRAELADTPRFGMANGGKYPIFPLKIV